MLHFSSSFGQYRNMAYNFGDFAEVRSNVDDFLKSNGFSSQDKIVVCNPVHKNKFAFLDKSLFDSLSGKKVDERFLDLDGVITDLPNVPVCFKPADCAVVGFEFSSPIAKGGLRGISHTEYFALLHIGFDDYLNDIVSEFNKFIVSDEELCSLKIRKIQVFPFLQKYRIDYGEFHSDKYDWDSLGKIQEYIEKDEKGRFVNFHKPVYNKLVKVFNKDLIDWGLVEDTFNLAKEKRCFSHSLSNFHPEFKNGRNMVVGEKRLSHSA